MDAVPTFQRRGRRPFSKLEGIILKESSLKGESTGLANRGDHSSGKSGGLGTRSYHCGSKATNIISTTFKKKSKSSSSLDKKSKKFKKKDRLDRNSTHRTPLRRQDSEKLIELWTDTPPSSFANAPFNLSPFVGKSASPNPLLSPSGGKSKKSSKKQSKRTRRNSLSELSEHSRTLDDASKHSKKGSSKKKSGSRRKSFTDLSSPIRRFSKKNVVIGESSSSTADTSPLTPYDDGMRPTLDVECLGEESSSYLDATASSALSSIVTAAATPTISEESPAGRSATSSKKAARRNSSSSKKPSSSRKLKDKKKSKKEKKQKKASKQGTPKEKDWRKKPKKAKSGSLSKHLSASNRSLGSFGSQRSLGSYVSDAPTCVSNTSFVSFVSISVRQNSNDDALNGSSNHSRRSVRGIRKVRIGQRKVPLVSMPEITSSPDTSRRAYNDNASSHTSRSFSNHTAKLRYGIHMSPSPITKSLSVLTPTTAESSSIGGSSRLTITESTNATTSNSSNGGFGGPSTPKSKFQMVPKSQSFCDPMSRWSPDFPKSSSAPSFSERTGSRTSLAGIHNECSPSCSSELEFPRTKFCSAPRATHPNESVANAWASPFEGVNVKYVDGEEYKRRSTGGGKAKTKTPSSPWGGKSPKTKPVAKTRSSPTIKKPPSEAFDDTRSECSEDSEIDDPWENYGPASLIRASTCPNPKTTVNNHDSGSGRASLAYSDDDISALTMSLRTEGSSLAANSPVGRNPKFVAMKASHQPQQRRVRPRSPTPPKIHEMIGRHDSDNDGSQRERFMKGFDVSGTEGSISLHDCSVRSERSAKRTSRPRKNDTPAAPRTTTPPRIRFGEGNSESPRPRDQSPLMPQRRVSHHDRGDEQSFGNNNDAGKKTVMGIPVIPNLDSSDKAPRNKLGDIEEDEDEEDHATRSSHGICDDADAAAGNPTKSRETADPGEREPSAPGESFSTRSHRVGALIESFEALDGHRAKDSGGGGSNGRTSRSPSPSYRRRPEGLQPMLPTDMAAIVNIRRSPSMPVTPSKTAKAKILPPRHHSDLNTSSHHGKEKKKAGTVTASPMLRSPTKMSMKVRAKNTAAAASTKDALTDTDHSKAKEVICGTSSDFRGAPKKVVRDASYHDTFTTDEDLDATNNTTATFKKKKKKDKKNRGVRRRSSTGGSGIPPSPRPRSRTPTKYSTKKKASVDDGDALLSPMRRRRSREKSRKPSKRTSKSPRRRSKTPEHKYGRCVRSDDDEVEATPRRKVASKASRMKDRGGVTSEPTTPIGGLQQRFKNVKVIVAPATVGCSDRRGRSHIRDGARYFPDLPLTASPGRGVPPTVSSSRSPSGTRTERSTSSSRSRRHRSPCKHRSRKSRSPTGKIGRGKSGSLSLSRSPGRSKSPSLPCPPREGIFGITPRKGKKKKDSSKKKDAARKKAGADDKTGFQPPFSGAGIKA